MLTSISTANFYKIPFIDTLNIIKSAGFEYIELAGYWIGGEWEIAQHLKGIPVKDVLQMIKDSSLKISTLHDMGGVIDNKSDTIISDTTYKYLEYSEFEIPCIVFHTPHKKSADIKWWNNYQNKAISDLDSIKGNHIICLENIPYIDNYFVPLITPEEMLSFADKADIHINIDTTHYAQCNIDLNHAAHHLKDRVKTIHLSDFNNGKPHYFIGYGELKFKEFAQKLNFNSLHAVTIECGVPTNNMDYTYLIDKYREAKSRTEKIFRF